VATAGNARASPTVCSAMGARKADTSLWKLLQRKASQSPSSSEPSAIVLNEIPKISRATPILRPIDLIAEPIDAG